VKRRLCLLLVAWCILLGWELIGCHWGAKAEQQRYELNGTVVSVDRALQRATIAHEDIPGFMGAMTMPFILKDRWVFGVLAPGDRVSAVLVVDPGSSWLEGISITKAATQEPGTQKIQGSSEPQAGDLVLDFSLVNQDGKLVRLSHYRGRAVVLTFIYTRCPLPDYCPLMSYNLDEITKALRKEPPLYAKTHLISISIDPDHDTAKVLRQYGKSYSDDFGHWEFASGSRSQVREIAGFFGLNYFQEGGQIVHSLCTALVGPDGRLLKLYRGNEWKPEAVLSDLRSVFNGLKEPVSNPLAKPGKELDLTDAAAIPGQAGGKCLAEWFIRDQGLQ
jgi:protein SCO1